MANQNTDDRLKESLVEVIDWLKVGAEQSKDFVIEQAPMVAQEYVAWTFWEAVIGLAVCLLLAPLACLAFAITIRWMRDDEFGDPSGFVGAIITGMLAIGVFIGAYANATTAIKATVAPRVVIIEKIATLTK